MVCLLLVQKEWSPEELIIKQGEELEDRVTKEVHFFYVSLEDDLMRIFGSESMNNMLEKLGLKDGESIDHPWINKALERAQQK